MNFNEKLVPNITRKSWHVSTPSTLCTHIAMATNAVSHRALACHMQINVQHADFYRCVSIRPEIESHGSSIPPVKRSSDPLQLPTSGSVTISSDDDYFHYWPRWRTGALTKKEKWRKNKIAISSEHFARNGSDAKLIENEATADCFVISTTYIIAIQT